MEGLIEGRIVHFVLGSGKHRPAIIVQVWRDADGKPPANGCCNLQVFADSDSGGKWNDAIPPVSWATSICFDPSGAPTTWHWIEKA